MRCPQCGGPLTWREYAWTHRHVPPRILRRLGAIIMMIGGFYVGVGLLEIAGMIR